MKLHSIALCLSLMLFMVLVSSCARPTESATTPFSETPLPPTSSATLAPSSTLLQTDTPTITTTPTMIPTLSAEAAHTDLLKLLSNNSGCRLPCLWGITPGISTYEEAQAILAPLSSISELTGFRPEGGAIFPVYTEGNLMLYTVIGFNVHSLSVDKIVSRIGFRAEAHRSLAEGGYEDVFDSTFFGDKISAYTLPHVLSEQGIPSSVMIVTFGGPLTRGGTGGFEILLLYPNKGILVNYTTQMHLTGPNVRGCLANAHVEMELYPPGGGDSFFERLKETDWSVKLNYYKPLEEVTSMSLEEFYNAFRKPTDQCVETPANLWPIPEP